MVCGIVGLILWPFTLKAIFSGTRSAESFNSIFFFGDLSVRLQTMLGVLSDNSVGIPYMVLLPLLLILPLAALILARKNKAGNIIVPKVEKGFILGFPFCMYFLIVSKIIPYLVDRYIMCLFPLCFILLFCSFFCLIRQLIKKNSIRNLVLVPGFALLLFCSNAFRHYNPYIFEDGQETDMVENDTDCIYVLPANWWNQSAEDTILLSKCDMSAVVSEDKLEILKASYVPVPGRKLMIVVRDGIDTDADVAYLLDNIAAEGYRISYKEKDRVTKRGRTVISFDLSSEAL
ncbi:MAG: hypothetical protein K6B44_01480 [Lachnospiraceae bacterium]|nr:hypothetical protein [Lachnospiraceae bacterium]